MASRWTASQIVAALDAYLEGHGLKEAARRAGRGVEATSNLIRSDLPRDYRGCVKWIEGCQGRRTGSSWTMTELNYLITLRKKERPDKDIALLLGRDWREVLNVIKTIEPKQDSPRGFFDTGGDR